MVVVLLPVIMLRDYTPSNELRYLSIADEALRNHTFFTFYSHGEVYADKPPLYFWALMLCRWLTGEYKMWMLALFSLLPAIGILRVMDNWVIEEMDGEHRRLAMGMLIGSGLFLSTSVFLRMDMLMAFLIVLALREFWRIYCPGAHRQRSLWLFPVYLFLAVFTKGPLGLLIPLCATLVFLVVKKQTKSICRFWGWRTWLTLLLPCLVWFAGIYAEGGREYLDNLLIHQTVGRAVNSFHHKEAFYYYLVHIWYCAAPWSFLVIGVLIFAQRKRFVQSDLQRFFQIVFIATVVLLSCISGKLQIYMLPAIPFLIYAAVMFLPRLDCTWWAKLSLALPAVIFVLVTPALLAFCTAKDISSWGGMWVYLAACVLGATGLHTLWQLYGKRENHATIPQAIRCMGIGWLAAVFFGGWGMPRINQEIGYGALCEKATSVAGKYQISDFKTWHIIRPENMDVYLRHPVQVIPDDSVPTAVPGKPYLLITRKRYLPQMQAPSQPVVMGKYAIIRFQNPKKIKHYE